MLHSNIAFFHSNEFIRKMSCVPKPGSGKISGCLTAGLLSGFLPTIELNNFQTFLIDSRFKIMNLFEISLKSNSLETKKDKSMMFRLKNLFFFTFPL